MALQELGATAVKPRPSLEPGPAAADNEDTAELGLRRFFHQNETLLKMLSLLLAAAGFLRNAPQDDAVAFLISLVMVMALLTFLRLWRDLPRTMGVLPADNWTPELTLFYYCLTAALVVSVAYLMAGIVVTRREQDLWVVLATVVGLALAVGTNRLGKSAAARSVLGGAFPRLNDDQRHAIASSLVIAVTVLIIPLAYWLGHQGAGILNEVLDQMLTGGRAVGSPPAVR